MPSFKQLSGLDYIDLQEAAQAAGKAVLARFPELADLKGDEYRNHPKHARFVAEYDLYAAMIPAIQAAWGDATEPPSMAEIVKQPMAEIIAWCREIRRLNPYLEELPAPLPAAEGAAPNA